MSGTTRLATACVVLALAAGTACAGPPGSRSRGTSTPSASNVATPAGVSTDAIRPSTRPVPVPKDVRQLHVTYTYGGTRHTLDDYLRRAKARGFVVLDHDTIVTERYVHADAETRFQSWSMAKSFTSTAVGIALGEHRIRSLDDPVTRYLPELGRSGYDGVPIRDVLRMSSGIDWNEERDAPRMQAAAHRGVSLTRMAERQRRGWRPGTRFEYDSMNYFVLGWLVTRVTGMPYYRYVQTRIWQPAGMASTAAIGDDGHGDALGYCCYYAADRDFARLGLLFLRHGRAHGRQVVPSSWVGRSTRPSSSRAPNYGLGWWLGGEPDGDYMGVGLGGQYVYVSPRYGVVLVQSASGNDLAAKKMEAEARTAFRATAEAVARTR